MDVLAYQVRAGARKDCLIAAFAATANETYLKKAFRKSLQKIYNKSKLMMV
jgi:hypothetical protein